MREQHLDLDALADLLAGEGSADDVEHVAHCSDCSASLADLDDALSGVDPVLEALLAAPVPDLPTGFDARLAARLAEVEPDAAAPVPSPVPSPVPAPVPAGLVDTGDDTDSDSDDEADRDAGRAGAAAPGGVVVPLRRRPRGAGLLGVAAGGVGLLVAGALGLSVLGSGGADSESAAAGALPATGAQEQADGGAALSAAPLVLASGTDYRPEADAVAALLPGLLGAAAAEQFSGAGDAGGSSGGGTGAADAVEEDGGDDEGVAGERSAEQAPVAQAPAPAAAGAPADGAVTLASDPLARLREPGPLNACLEAVAASAAGSAPEVQPLALDYASTGGEPALVVVQRAAPGLVEVTAVGPACSAADPARRWSLRLPG